MLKNILHQRSYSFSDEHRLIVCDDEEQFDEDIFFQESEACEVFHSNGSRSNSLINDMSCKGIHSHADVKSEHGPFLDEKPVVAHEHKHMPKRAWNYFLSLKTRKSFTSKKIKKRLWRVIRTGWKYFKNGMILYSPAVSTVFVWGIDMPSPNIYNSARR